MSSERDRPDAAARSSSAAIRASSFVLPGVAPLTWASVRE
jgi:hypothetical protein